MEVTRRRILGALTVAAGATEVASAQLSTNAVRETALVHGAKLAAERPEILRPVLEKRIGQLQALRDLELDETVEPVQGVMED